MSQGENRAEAPSARTETTVGDGEMRERIRQYDWSNSPLGAAELWPQSLRTVVNILLSSRYAMWMAWGAELTMLYNDAYAPTLGLKHLWALGTPAKQVWAEIWPDVGPRIESVLTTGLATYDEGLLLFLERSGFPEETYHTFSYSPLLDDGGEIAGMLCVVTEETDRLIGERRVETLRQVASALSNTSTEEEVWRSLDTQLNANKYDLPFTLTYLFEAGGARRVGASGISTDHPLASEWIADGFDFPWPAQQVFQRPALGILCDLAQRREIDPPPPSVWNKPPKQAAIVSIRHQGQDQPAGFFVVGTNPYRRYDTAYRGFVELLAGQISAALNNARAYQAERQRAEALAEIDRAKTTFFSNVSHELRTPLTLVLSPVEELLARDSDQTPRARELLLLAHRNGLRLQKLVNTLLDFSRIEAGRFEAIYEPTELAEFTENLASNFRTLMERASLSFIIDCESLPELVYVDREMWEKIVFNLLSNALKFTFNGEISVTLRAEGKHAQLTVRDSGTGIPEAELPHVFERFHRVAGAKGRTIEGTGIGLALVQGLVKLHCGSISVQSEISKGSTFAVTIPFGKQHLPADRVITTNHNSPIAPRSEAFLQEAFRWLSDRTAGDGLNEAQSAADISQDALDSDQDAKLEKVLVADDNADMRDYVKRLLSERYRVVTASDGEQALKSAIAELPDLILSDVMMPGLDGFGLLKELRARTDTRTIPVVLLSARAGEESAVGGLEAGADDYLIKPFTARELLARVSAHLSMRRRRLEAQSALKESQSTLQSFYDSSPYPMGVIELDGDNICAIHLNAASATFLGTHSTSGVAPGGTQLGTPPEITAIWVKHYQQSQIEGHPIRFEYLHPSPGPVGRWLDASVNFLGYSPNGRPRFNSIAIDITGRKTNEQLLQRSNEELLRANADLEQFAYSASHDLQEPLRQVAIFSQLLEMEYASKLDGNASEYLAYCVEGARRMEMLIKDLLAYCQAAKKSDSPQEWVSVDAVLERAKKTLFTTIAETEAEIRTSALPVVCGDSAPLVHLFQNLISNALKYRSELKPQVIISAVKDAGYWRFSVEDNGIGIPPEFHAQVFGIFKRLHDRTKYPGTGIGLAICQKIVERYGGRIWVESEPGRGSTFFFTLPRAAN